MTDFINKNDGYILLLNDEKVFIPADTYVLTETYVKKLVESSSWFKKNYDTGPDSYRKGIVEVCIPSNVIEIQERTFIYCENLKSVSFCSSGGIKYIGQSAFDTCKSLELFDFNACCGPIFIGNSAFFECGFTKIEFADISVVLGDACFANCTKLLSVKNLNTKIIPQDCFSYCLELLSVSCSRIYAVEYGAFADCNSLLKFDCGYHSNNSKYDPYIGGNNDPLLAVLKQND